MTVTTKCACEGRGYADRRCLRCGSGECAFCASANCMRDGVSRPSGTIIDGVHVDECGRYMRAGEMAATWIILSADKKGTLRFALCMRCFDRATAEYLASEGVLASRFMIGTLENCIPCGYHSAQLST